MSKTVLDTSAILAYLFEENGSDKVATVLKKGAGVIGSANYAELTSKLCEKEIPIEKIQTLINNLELEFIPQDEQQAFLTGTLRMPSKKIGLSLGDRSCLALGILKNMPVMTADKAWLDIAVDTEVYCIR